MTARHDVTRRDRTRGLTSREARDRLVHDGPNVLPDTNRRNLAREFVRQLTHLLALLLWVAVILAFLAGMPELSVAIAVIVVLNAAFAFWQAYRAYRSTQQLRELLPSGTRVLRDGHSATIDVSELVRGDTVMLGAGDRVGADLHVHVAHELSLDESLLTRGKRWDPRTAEAIAREVGLLPPTGGLVVTGSELPNDDRELADLLDRAEGAVVARVTPADKFRIARVLREHGHVVAMTGDGVNDAPALREADVGIAMGATGSDVAREAADLVLLDDHFATIVAAAELGRATFRNVRRFLTYHLTDNIAELTPFALWALSGGQFPLAIGVLQVLAL